MENIMWDGAECRWMVGGSVIIFEFIEGSTHEEWEIILWVIWVCYCKKRDRNRGQYLRYMYLFRVFSFISIFKQPIWLNFFYIIHQFKRCNTIYIGTYYLCCWGMVIYLFKSFYNFNLRNLIYCWILSRTEYNLLAWSSLRCFWKFPLTWVLFL